MRRKYLAAFLMSMTVMLFGASVQARLLSDDDDTDTRLVNAQVTEITDARISVMAQTGVEHVIAIDMEKTRVQREGKNVSIKEVREGDVITIELDEKNPVKFARNISMQTEATVARNRR